MSVGSGLKRGLSTSGKLSVLLCFIDNANSFFFSLFLTADFHADLRTAPYQVSSIHSYRHFSGAAGRFMRSQESLDYRSSSAMGSTTT
jgi:hypothetical protein